MDHKEHKMHFKGHTLAVFLIPENLEITEGDFKILLEEIFIYAFPFFLISVIYEVSTIQFFVFGNVLFFWGGGGGGE